MTKKITQTAGRTLLGDFASEFAHYNDDVLFGENWNNHDITIKTRCLITVVALIASGITDSSLKYHLENARNNWHIHHAKKGGGQILIGVAGIGYYQEEGKEKVVINPGDVINIAPEVKHWHGAAPDGWFSHLAVEVPREESSNEWLEPVIDEEYY